MFVNGPLGAGSSATCVTQRLNDSFICSPYFYPLFLLNHFDKIHVLVAQGHKTNLQKGREIGPMTKIVLHFMTQYFYTDKLSETLDCLLMTCSSIKLLEISTFFHILYITDQ